MFAGNFAPAGWMFCNGQLLPIDQYETLFNLIGTTYGGDGQSTFALPNLQGRLPVHQGNSFVLSQSGGSETVTLTSTQTPMHSHAFLCTASTGAQRNPVGNSPAIIVAGSAYNQDPPTAALAPQSISADGGGGQPHDNMQPYQCVSFIISLFGVFPSQS
ncbi:MAG TPA: tail fiber protein [Streptosporangiaceae bacterium]|jgi:microcystin-dependent protein